MSHNGSYTPSISNLKPSQIVAVSLRAIIFPLPPQLKPSILLSASSSLSLKPVATASMMLPPTPTNRRRTPSRTKVTTLSIPSSLSPPSSIFAVAPHRFCAPPSLARYNGVNAATWTTIVAAEFFFLASNTPPCPCGEVIY
ncbi:hypothetical protein RIF29_10221 [Crotalaria pallida]|uniref:Uncharacterized protein n=1 Tax=Crotalaria pallida TaxID=3830 RepID=A0AAN9FSN3_CROPI